MSALATSRRRVIALVAAGALTGGIVGVLVSQLGVASAGNGPGSTPSPAEAPPIGFMPGLGGGPDFFGGPGGRVLHGEATVAGANGKTFVVRMQSGDITGLAGSSVTVRSTDGFTATYTVDKTTRIVLNGADGALSALKKGDAVRVFGVVDGSAVHAKAVLDGMPRLERWFARHWRHDGHMLGRFMTPRAG